MLRRKAIRCGRNRLVCLMRGLGLQAVKKRRFRPKTPRVLTSRPSLLIALTNYPSRPAHLRVIPGEAGLHYLGGRAIF
jgi:hypothetical protein